MTGVRSWGIVYLKGLSMGAADAVPGVSGGTIALITGIYERLIGAITAISPGRIRRFLNGFNPRSRADALVAAREMDLGFLIALGSGVVTAVVTITRLIDVALESFPVVTFGFFFGLIAASAAVLYGDVTLDTRGRVAAAVAGFLAAFLVSGEAAAALGHSLPVTFVAGLIAVSALILPGISGSLLLILLGQYEFMVDTLRTTVDGLLAAALGGGVNGFSGSLLVVVTFVSGAFVGLFSISHVVRWALRHYRKATLAFLVSLIVGALRAPVANTSRRLAEAGDAWTPEVVGLFLAAAVVGAVAVLLLERAAGTVSFDGTRTNADRQ